MLAACLTARARSISKVVSARVLRRWRRHLHHCAGRVSCSETDRSDINLRGQQRYVPTWALSHRSIRCPAAGGPVLVLSDDEHAAGFDALLVNGLRTHFSNESVREQRLFVGRRARLCTHGTLQVYLFSRWNADSEAFLYGLFKRGRFVFTCRLSVCTSDHLRVNHRWADHTPLGHVAGDGGAAAPRAAALHASLRPAAVVIVEAVAELKRCAVCGLLLEAHDRCCVGPP